MRSCLALSTFAMLASVLLLSSRALADEPAPAAPAATQPASDAPPAPDTAEPPPTSLPPATPPPTTPSPTAEPPATSPDGADRAGVAPASPDEDTRRSEGFRLGLDLGFQRGFDGAADRLNYGTPTLLPLGVEVAYRTSKSLLVGVRGYAALASRDDCISADSCRARAYGFGFAIEGPLARGKSIVPWIRYGAGYELLYQGGAPLDAAGHAYRGAFDLLDLRVGADLIASRGDEGKTTRIGAFIGLVGGFVVNQSGVSYLNSGGGNASPRNLDGDSGSAHLWFVMGLRGTLDP
jgi:hypothetical protein